MPAHNASNSHGPRRPPEQETIGPDPYPPRWPGDRRATRGQARCEPPHSPAPRDRAGSQVPLPAGGRTPHSTKRHYSTVTDLAKFLGISTSHPRRTAR